MSSRRTRKKKTAAVESSPHWMTTYSDLVTLLLGFFILLFSISSINVERFQQIFASIQTSFLGYTGIMESEPEPLDLYEDLMVPENNYLEQALAERTAKVEAIKEKVEAFLLETGLEGTVEIRFEQRGVVMDLPDYIFFERGSAELRPEARQFLDKLSVLFSEMDDNNIIVEGHTCNLPINTPFYPTNWELSVARSVRVVRYLVEVKGMKPERFVATGYGEYQPLDTNETPEGRARNRRVTMVIAVD